jgi:hypothetical protein
VFNSWQERIGLHDEAGRPVHVTLHQLRHTFGTRLINSGVPQHVIQCLLCHASPEMTCRDVSHEFAERLDARGHHDHCVRDVHRGGGEIHTVNRVNVEATPHVVDWTGRQYDPDVDVPHVEPWHTWEQQRYRYGNKSIWKIPAKEPTPT